MNRSCAISIGNNWFAELDWDFLYERPELCDCRAKQALCKWPTRSHSPLHHSITSLCIHIVLLNKLLLFLPRSMSCRIIFYSRTTEPSPPSRREQLEGGSLPCPSTTGLLFSLTFAGYLIKSKSWSQPRCECTLMFGVGQLSLTDHQHPSLGVCYLFSLLGGNSPSSLSASQVLR